MGKFKNYLFDSKEEDNIKNSDSKIDYSKYIKPIEIGNKVLYIFDLPIGIETPIVGSIINYKNKQLKVVLLQTPEDIGKGRGGGIANSMRDNGIAYRIRLSEVDSEK